MNLGVKIKELRKTKQLSQDAFAEQFSVTRQTVSNWENGKSYPDLETIVKLSETFNLPVDDLLKDDTALVKKIDGEKKKKNVLGLTLIGLLLLFMLISFAIYRYIQVTNHVAFTIKKTETLQLQETTRKQLDVANGYFAMPRSGKVNLTTKGASDSGRLAIVIMDQANHQVYQIDGDSLADSQTLQLKKGSYHIQITANDYAEDIISLSYDVTINNQ